MRALPVLLSSVLLLAGCASAPPDPGGTWINRAAIEAATQGGNLREALLAYGPNLEWQIDSQRRVATFSNGFETGEGQLVEESPGHYRVDFYGDYRESLSLDDEGLTQAASDTWPEQRFARPGDTRSPQLPLGGRFEQALYSAYLGGTWTITQGIGEGGLVRFNADGTLEGLPGAERYALCLAGDCAAMSGEFDSLWLQRGEHGRAWLFEREDGQLRLFEALNRARPDEMPDYHKGPQHWLLQHTSH